MTRTRLNMLIGLAFALVAGMAAMIVSQHEATLARGEVVLLELAPVDPRSLMQGDYMALRFAVDRQLPPRLESTTGADSASTPPPRFAFIVLDSERRATLVGTGSEPMPGAGQIAMRIRVRDHLNSVGPNAFFFREGSGADYEAARWGEFRVDADGNALLTHLRDAQLVRVGTTKPFSDLD